MSLKILDLSIALDARQYIDEFEVPGAPSKMTYVELSGGEKIEFSTMTDAQAVRVAHCLYDMKTEAELRVAKRSGLIN